MVDLVYSETTNELIGISTEILQKAGLLELNEK